MRASSRLLAPLLVMLFGPSAYAQFHVDASQLAAKAPVVAVLPTQALPGIEDGEAIAASLDTELAAALTKAGFKVHGADVYQSVENEYRGIVGGWFDPLTGAVKQPAREVVFGRTVQALQDRMQVKGFVRADFEPRQIEFKNAKQVAWDGVVEDVISKEGLFAGVDRAFGIRDSGRISVISLKLKVFDDKGQPIYEAYGGVAATAALVNKKFVQVDVAATLADVGRLQRALDVITWPMTHDKARDPVQQFSGAKTAKRASRSTLPMAAEVALPASVPAAQIKQQVMTVALKPIDTVGHPYDSLVKARYEKELSDKLAQFGFRLIAPSAYARVAEAAAAEVGGIYDPITGKLAPDKAKAAQEVLVRRLRETQAVDAILSAEFTRVGAPYDTQGEAAWDGATQSVFAVPGGWNGKAYTGTQSALSLLVRLEDIAGQHLYSRRGGIELTSLFMSSSGDFERLPPEKLLIDESKTAHAVEVALAGLSDGT